MIPMFLLLLAAGLAQSAQNSARESEGRPLFERDVVPIFAAHCLKCHGLEARHADLDLRTPPLILRGGKSGPAVVPTSAEKSLLFQKVSTAAMPPGKELKPTPEQIETLRRWIDGGAPDSADLWAAYQGRSAGNSGEGSTVLGVSETALRCCLPNVLYAN